MPVDALHAHRAVTHVLLVPATINLFGSGPGIDEERFDDLRLVLYGASLIAPDVLRRAIQVFGCDFLQLFGMTETAGCAICYGRPIMIPTVAPTSWPPPAPTGSRSRPASWTPTTSPARPASSARSSPAARA